MTFSLPCVLAGLAMATLGATAGAASLSHRLSEGEIDTDITLLSMGSAHKPWTAAAVENPDLGLDIGLESTFLMRRDIDAQGDNSGIIPTLIPVPRLWVMWDLPANFQSSMSFAPGMLYGGITAFGMGGQWAYYRKPDIQVTSSLAVNYTYASAFGQLRSNTLDVAVQASRNLEVWQPYVGAGLMMTLANVDPGLLAADVGSGPYTRFATHVYFGTRVDLLAKLAVQVDFINTQASLSALMAMSF